MSCSPFALLFWQKKQGLRDAIFFPKGYSLYFFSYFGSFIVVWGFGVGVLYLVLGFWGWGFQLMGFGPVVWGVLGFLGWGSLYKHKIITLGKKWYLRDKATCNIVIGMSHLHFGQQQTTPQCYFLLSKNQIREFFNYVVYIVYVGLSGAESRINFSNYLCWSGPW